MYVSSHAHAVAFLPVQILEFGLYEFIPSEDNPGGVRKMKKGTEVNLSMHLHIVMTHTVLANSHSTSSGGAADVHTRCINGAHRWNLMQPASGVVLQQGDLVSAHLVFTPGPLSIRRR